MELLKEAPMVALLVTGFIAAAAASYFIIYYGVWQYFLFAVHQPVIALILLALLWAFVIIDIIAIALFLVWAAFLALIAVLLDD